MGLCNSTPVDATVTVPDSRQGANKAEVTGDAAVVAAGSASVAPLYKPVLGNTQAEDVKKLYEFDKMLGKGQFGVTRLVRERSTGQQYACKTISKRKLVNPEDIEDVRREIKVMHHLSGHPNVVEFKGAYEDNQNVHIVMELCTGQ